MTPFLSSWPFSCDCLYAVFKTIIIAAAGMALICPPQTGAAETEKVVIGAVEKVVIMPWSVELSARVDSGAARTSIDARDLKIEGEEAVFSLPSQSGGKRIRLPVKGWKKVKSSHGATKRPLVEIDICIGQRRIPVTVSLVDRSQMNYPMIIGRDILAKGFVVDVTKSNIISPACPDGERK